MDDDRELARIVEALKRASERSVKRTGEGSMKRAGEGSLKRGQRTRDRSPIRRRPYWVDPDSEDEDFVDADSEGRCSPPKIRARIDRVHASRHKFGRGAHLCDESEPEEEEGSEITVAATVAAAGVARVVKGGNEKGECSPIRAEGEGDVEVLHLQFGPHKVSIRTYRDKSQTEGKEKGVAVAPKVALAGVEVVGTAAVGAAAAMEKANSEAAP